MRYMQPRKDGLYDVYECRGATVVCIAVARTATQALALIRRQA